MATLAVGKRTAGASGKMIDLGGLQEALHAAKKQRDRDARDLARAQDAYDRSSVAWTSAHEALKAATRTILAV